ncbi:MAG: hypothetical protein GY759_03510 [Chloroflexi bacterium]|nr:hypothetical protein [Chloroflexota bacterium]
MMQLYATKLILTILGPFLTAATATESYGVDKSFHRNYKGELTIPASHVKGKLRMAFMELEPYFGENSGPDLVHWFGKPSEENQYTPELGMLRFSDLICESKPSHPPANPSTRTRVTINRESQTAAEHLLREVEDHFTSGSKTEFMGKISFFAESEAEARELVKVLAVGLRWLPNLGAEKGVGFGRLSTVSIAEPLPERRGAASAVDGGEGLHLRISPNEPILVGGIKKRRTNFVSSRRLLSGGLLKGALATALNESYGVRPPSNPIEAASAVDFEGYETLVKHFSKIRVTHAFPTYTGDPRPLRIPISTVEVGDELRDSALSDDVYPLSDSGDAPAYFIDWKKGRDFFGGASPQTSFVTRSAIEETSRRTLSGQLFTYAFLHPHDDQGRAIEWVCDVDFSAIEDSEARVKAREEFAKAMQLLHLRLGKLDRSAQVEVRNGFAQPLEPSLGLVKDGLAIITLQTDAIMLDPAAVSQLAPAGDLHDLYAAFWHVLSGAEVSGACFELIDFYAHQGFEGGYLYHRYLGSVERKTRPQNYRPYYVTRAGSVFKLKVVDEKAARKCLSSWLAHGIPLPSWADQVYNQYGTDLWQTCPFVPENGYGEITVNLAWHWNKQLASSHSE